MPTATVRQIGSDALLELGVLQAGEVASDADITDAMNALNRLMDAWAAERLQIYQVTRTTWTITANDGDYTVGSGGNVNIARPVFIDHVNFQDTSTDPDTEYQLSPLTDDAWSKIPQKDLTNTYPTSWYYNPTYPTGTLELWPVPTSSTLQGVLYAPQATAEFSSLSTSVALPPGYMRMLVKNLALELAPSYEKEVSPMLLRQAIEAKETVKRSNKRLMDLSIDAGALGQGVDRRFYWDIYVGG